MINDAYKNFLIDVIYEIKNKKDIFDKDTDLNKGYNFALYEIMSLLIEQSEIFGLDQDELGLENIDLEKDYLEM